MAKVIIEITEKNNKIEISCGSKTQNGDSEMVKMVTNLLSDKLEEPTKMIMLEISKIYSSQNENIKH